MISDISTKGKAPGTGQGEEKGPEKEVPLVSQMGLEALLLLALHFLAQGVRLIT